MVRRLLFLGAGLSLAAAPLVWTGAPPALASAPPAAPNCPILPANNVWHADVSGLPVNAHSAAWLSSANAGSTNLHPDFGSSGDPSAPYGIPWIAVPDSHAKVTPTFDYADESDPGPYPFGPDTPIEGGQQSTGDRHALMLDKDACVLYELYNANWNGGRPTAGSGAVFNLNSNALRPATWTSADAAGLPILPGLLRLDEVQSGHVGHAIRFTVQRTDKSFIWPARHQAGSASDANLPPMGARFRLRGDFNMAGYRPDTQVVLRAMQHYGLIVADNGSNWYFQGEAINNWDDGFIADLKRVPASAFEAVDESSLMIDPNSGEYRGGPAPASPAPGLGTTATHATPKAPPRGAGTPLPAVATTTTTTVADTTTSVFGPLPTPDVQKSPQSGEVALGTPHSSHGVSGWAPWVAGGLLLGAGGALFWGWRWRRA
ncbi:MAG: hypothetical protein JO075_06585 [Acidimicrobiia bacterium]|nr:hypothetical protein [Acidimicrobiia bacterium]